MSQPLVSIRKVLFLVVPLALVTVAVAGYYYRQNPPIEDLDSLKLRNFLRLGLSAPSKLDKDFTDANGDLVADAPTDAAKQLDPETIVFCLLGSDIDREKAEFADLTAHLSKTIGKPVEVIEWQDSIDDQAKAMKNGKIHLALFSTGSVGTAVNRGGAVPFAVMADKDGKFGYTMELIVPTKSPAKSPADLKGKTISFISPYSLSGFKAPVVILWKEFDLQPWRDYEPPIGESQESVAEGVSKGKLAAAPVAGDYLKRLIAQGKVGEKDVRSIYTSPVYPPACVVHASQLKPELATKIKSAILGFDWKGTSLEKAYAPTGSTKFTEITYKDAWAPVRAVEADGARLVATETAAKK